MGPKLFYGSNLNFLHAFWNYWAGLTSEIQRTVAHPRIAKTMRQFLATTSNNKM